MICLRFRQSGLWSTILAKLYLPWDPGQQHRSIDTDQSPHQLSHSWTSSFPPVFPWLPLWFQQPLQAALPTHINYSLSPVALTPPFVTPGVTESGRSEVVLPTATPGISQKSLCMKPCGPAGQHPHDPLQVRGVRDPPLSSQQWSVPISLICRANYFI